MTIHLCADEWTLIPGRGRVAVISGFELEGSNIHDPSVLMGQDVLIDGDPYTVTGVETFAIHRSVDHPYRLPAGLLVRAPS